MFYRLPRLLLFTVPLVLVGSAARVCASERSPMEVATAVSSSAPGIRLEAFAYPFPEKTYRFTSQRQELEMVYMDITPETAPRGVLLLLHGKNFSGSYFGETARALRSAGYQVIIPDQIGFGKSTKPANYHYTFHQLARNTRDLLTTLKVDRVHVLGHSMGGMLATRFALLYPETTASLTLLNPIGLEDWQALGVPYSTVDDNYRQELAKTPAQIRAYQLKSYYDGQWQDAYDPWVKQLASFNLSPDYPLMAWNQALTSDMVFTQPVVHDFHRLKPPVLLLIGQRDRTAIGRALAPPSQREKLGDYPALGRAARAAIPGAELVEFDGLGHLPHIEDFPRFFPPYRAILDRHSTQVAPNN
jgi:pimeloyl-ACP methyl ester carboxylesterase